MMKPHETIDVNDLASRLAEILADELSVSQWVHKLSGGNEPLNTFLDGWIWLSNGFGSKMDDEGVIPAPSELEDFTTLSEILAAWCESEGRFDSSPFLLHLDCLQTMWDRADSGLSSELPESQWNRFCQSGWDAQLLIKRIRLYLQSKFPTSTPHSQTSQGTVKFNRSFDGIKQSQQEVLAIGLLFTIPNPTMTNIASALGYANHTSLARMKKFQFARHCFEVGQTFRRGEKKTRGTRRNGKPMSDIE